MAREQAENENKALRIQLEESKTRFHKLSQRLENVMVGSCDQSTPAVFLT